MSIQPSTAQQYLVKLPKHSREDSRCQASDKGSVESFGNDLHVLPSRGGTIHIALSAQVQVRRPRVFGHRNASRNTLRDRPKRCVVLDLLHQIASACAAFATPIPFGCCFKSFHWRASSFHDPALFTPFLYGSLPPLALRRIPFHLRVPHESTESHFEQTFRR